MAASSGVAVDVAFSFVSPFPAAKDRSFPLVHNTIPIKTADENRFMRISPATPAPFQRDLCNAQFVTRNLKIVGVARLSGRTKPHATQRKTDESSATARSQSDESCFSQHDQSSSVMKTLFGSFA